MEGMGKAGKAVLSREGVRAGHEMAPRVAAESVKRLGK
jgi:hypothetical protein